MKILITGSNGFIGGSVGRFAAKAGHQIVGTGRAAQAAAGWPGDYVQTDLEPAQFADIINHFAPGAVVHGAGSASVEDSFEAPLADAHASILTLANTLESIRQSHERPLILIPSSAAVYGNPSSLPVSETAAVNPISPYAFHMAARELIAREYLECFGLRVIVCRLFSVFGPSQRRLFVWDLYRQLKDSGSTVWLQGTGHESRDYLHVDDVAAIFLELMNMADSGNEAGYMLANVASGNEISMLELAHKIRDLIAPEKEVRWRGIVRRGHPRHWRADISRLRELIPESRSQPLTQRLAECIDDWDRDG